MYYDLILPYRLEPGCKLGKQESGEEVAIYTKLTFEGCDKAITEEEYQKFHEKGRYFLADKIQEKVELITPITGDEYEQNIIDEGNPAVIPFSLDDDEDE